MSNKKSISRRTALKVIAVGVGSAGALPIIEERAVGQHKHAGVEVGRPPTVSVAPAKGGKFFNPQELTIISLISDLIIPTDEHSPGAAAAGVAEFIDLMVSESSNEVRALWRDGLAAVDKLSQSEFSVVLDRATQQQQITLLKTISRNERRPMTIEERFFVAIKSLTVDGYYTSPVGIHQDLRYKGNAYLKEFTGCSHPEHMT